MSGASGGEVCECCGRQAAAGEEGWAFDPESGWWVCNDCAVRNDLQEEIDRMVEAGVLDVIDGDGERKYHTNEVGSLFLQVAGEAAAATGADAAVVYNALVEGNRRRLRLERMRQESD